MQLITLSWFKIPKDGEKGKTMLDQAPSSRIIPSSPFSLRYLALWMRNINLRKSLDKAKENVMKLQNSKGWMILLVEKFACMLPIQHPLIDIPFHPSSP
jgi:hypothetical protein